MRRPKAKAAIAGVGLLALVGAGLAAERGRRSAEKAAARALSPAPRSLAESLRASLPPELANPREAPRLVNAAAYLPAQCYAATLDDAPGEASPGAKGAKRTHNGCFACHQTSQPPNFTDDADVQTVLSLARYATENRWTNVLRPPAAEATTSDAELLAYVRTSNYRGPSGALVLPKRLAALPASWDVDANGVWDGYAPDCWFDVDDSGFDRGPDGAMTGWRAFAYAPFPGMFWPTNGSAGDVFIRLPVPFRQDPDGRESELVYRTNLAIVEAYIRRVDVPIPPTDERALGSDLDGDGVLATAHRVAFVWPPKPGRPFGYVGAAAALDTKRDGWPAAGLYPRGTEFLHSLRYLDVGPGERVAMAPRMKELRYMRKTRWLTYSDLQLIAEAEAREKEKSPNRLKTILGDAERGVDTGSGWRMQGFIEDARGELRPQSLEETAACIGCHGGIGATTDSTFAFARKLDARSAHRGGWYHWGERGLKGIAEPRRADGRGEYAHWLEEVGGGDDYRSNDEVQRRFFRADGTLDPAARAALAADISTLLVPSAERALALDRVYLALVKAQQFERGRDVTVGASPKILPSLEQDGSTGIEHAVDPGWATVHRRP